MTGPSHYVGPLEAERDRKRQVMKRYYVAALAALMAGLASVGMGSLLLSNASPDISGTFATLGWSLILLAAVFAAYARFMQGVARQLSQYLETGSR